MFAKVDDCMRRKFSPNPQIERKIGGWRRKSRIMIDGLCLLGETARRLDPNKHISKSYTGHRDVLNDGFRPSPFEMALPLPWQRIEKLLERLQLETLKAFFPVRLFRIIRNCRLQPQHQFFAIL